MVDSNQTKLIAFKIFSQFGLIFQFYQHTFKKLSYPTMKLDDTPTIRTTITSMIKKNMLNLFQLITELLAITLFFDCYSEIILIYIYIIIETWVPLNLFQLTTGLLAITLFFDCYSKIILIYIYIYVWYNIT